MEHINRIQIHRIHGIAQMVQYRLVDSTQAKKTLRNKNIHQYKLSNVSIQGTNCSSLHLLAQFLQASLIELLSNRL